jgi:coenzyme Q-binding protein COQ10
MPQFSTKRRVRHSAADMFDLVSDMDSYPQFVPLCAGMRVRGRTVIAEGIEVASAAMTVAYKMFHETFTTRVTMDKPNLVIKVEYIDGPFRSLTNRWSFRPIDERHCEVEFFIAYEFRSRLLAAVMGAVFDAAFRRFAEAFERRADSVYGRAPNARPQARRIET